MVLCRNCHNILTTLTDSPGVRYICRTCGREDKASHSDSRLIHDSKISTISRVKPGTVIYGYPANIKEAVPCPKCHYPITARELNETGRLVRGCQCGYSWIEIRREEVVAVAVPESKEEKK